MNWLTDITKMFLVARIATLFKICGTILATVGVTLSSQDQFQSASEQIVGLIFVLFSQLTTELVQKKMVATAPPVPESSASTLSSKTKQP